MAWEPNYIEDGDIADASSINTPLSSGRAEINALLASSLRRGAFGQYHALSPITEQPAWPALMATSGEGGRHTYVRSVFTPSLDYNAFGQDGGTETTGVHTGDRVIVGHPDVTGVYTGGLAKIVFAGSGYRVGMANGDRVGGIWLLFNCQIELTDPEATGMEIMFCFQYQNGTTGTWHTIAKSERFLSNDDHKLSATGSTEPIDWDSSIRTLITKELIAEDGAPAVDRVAGVRVMTSMYNPPAINSSYTLNRWQLTALPLHATDAP